MPGGSESTPQSAKLGLVPGVRLSIVDRPPGWRFEVDPTATEAAEPDAPADVILAFCSTAAAVRSRLPEQAPRIHPSGALWIAWPRKAAGHVSDVTENLLREVALPLGLVDVKVAAIDTDWSGLKLVWRRANR